MDLSDNQMTSGLAEFSIVVMRTLMLVVRIFR